VSAEAAFLHVLGQEQPVWWLDPMVEDQARRTVCIAKKHLNRFTKAHPEMYRPNSPITLLECLDQWGIEGGDPAAKDLAREVILSRRWEQDASLWPQILAYCAEDVRLTAQLFAKMAPHIALQPALIRGRYAAEHGRMFVRGMPADSAILQRLCQRYRWVLQGMRQGVDPTGDKLTPKGRVSQRWLTSKIAQLGAERRHPRTPTGLYSATVAALQSTAEEWEDPELFQVMKWAELLTIFLENRTGGLRVPPVGEDNRIRYEQMIFATHTGRSIGWGKEALMQQPQWMRGLVYPLPGEVVLAADYAGEEFAIAAGLSGDQRMQAAYWAGDPYLFMAEMAGMLLGVTAEKARQVRRLFKTLTLGRMYGLGLRSFREQSGLPYGEAVRVWQFFERTFARFLAWQARVVADARRRGWIRTGQGWIAKVYPMTQTTTLLNWLVQATGGDVLRTAVLLLADRGFKLLTTVHDSVLVSVPEQRAHVQAERVQHIMQEAATAVIGFPIRVDMQMVRPGERLLTTDTQPMWKRVMGYLDEGEMMQDNASGTVGSLSRETSYARVDS
jgi:hypothetical protein